MTFHHPPQKQQGQYRYDPSSLKQQGPARLFAYAGEDGILRFAFTTLQQSLRKDGRLSQPWNLFLQQIDQGLDSINQAWYYLTTQLADIKLFQSGWFNTDLPPDEQFSWSFAQDRRQMMAALMTAQRAAQRESELKKQRSRFYQALAQHGTARPVVMEIHEREDGLSDREFARQRLAGQNPMIIRRVQATDRALLDSLGTSELTTGLDLTQAANANQLFMADYPLLAGLTAAECHPGRYVGSPIALFHHSQQGLEPVLIQLEPGRVVTHKQDRDQWMQAKLYVQVADVTHHELIDHLCNTHLAMEAFAIATPRQLPANHPLCRLLKPHFQFLLAINTRGNEILLSEGAAIDNLMAPIRDVSLELIDRAYRDRPFEDYALPKNLEQRGVTSSYLPDFPYRDDALLLWQAINTYVSNFLQQYYRNDQAILTDPYLQAWAAELGQPLNQRPVQEFPQAPAWMPDDISTAIGLNLPERPAYARVPGFPGAISSLQQLIDIATTIIFTCGPQHAAVNFSQFDYVGYVPNAPLAAYCSPKDCKSLADLLPPADKDIAQIELTFALSGIRWGQLGSSELIQFSDLGDRAVLKQFQQDLKEIEQKIQERDQQRRNKDGITYPYLLPSRIPNSINI